MPEDLNELETFYYRIMSHLTPYITQKTIDFNRDTVNEACNNIGLKCPVVDKDSFSLLMPYAKDNLFGLKGSN